MKDLYLYDNDDCQVSRIDFIESKVLKDFKSQMNKSIYTAITTGESLADEESKRRFLACFPTEIDWKKFVDPTTNFNDKPTSEEEIEFQNRLVRFTYFDQDNYDVYSNDLKETIVNLLRTCSLRGIYAGLNLVVCFKFDDEGNYKGYLFTSSPYGILVDQERSDFYFVVVLDPEKEFREVEGVFGVTHSQIQAFLVNKRPDNSKLSISRLNFYIFNCYLNINRADRDG